MVSFHSNSKRHHNKVGIMFAIHRSDIDEREGDEILASLPPRGPPGSNDDTWQIMKLIDSAKRLGWLHFWHEALVHDPRGYGCLDARLEAMEVSIREEAAAGVMAVSPTEFCLNQMGYYVKGDSGPGGFDGRDRVSSPKEWMEAQHRDKLLGVCSHCGMHPSGWQNTNPEPLHPKVFSKCAGCRVAVYCSKECQRAAWKAGHKAECKLLQEEIKKIGSHA